MTTVTTAAANIVSPSLVQAREAAADALVRGYGATKAYASELTNEFGLGWYEKDSDAATKVAAEKKEFYAALKAGGHSNPSVAWGRVVKEAKAAESDEESDGANHTRSLTLRLIEELTKLHKAGAKSETKSERETNALTYVYGALSAMGVDVNTL
jgi:hypothetical protein